MQVLRKLKFGKILRIHYSKDPRNSMFPRYSRKSFSSFNFIKRFYNINSVLNKLRYTDIK